MRKSKFNESQIVGILKDAGAGVPVNDLLQKHGVSRATFFKWRSKYGGASVADEIEFPVLSEYRAAANLESPPVRL